MDVRVDGGTIAQIGASLDANGHKVIDGAGLVLAPAFIDPHVHLRTPGREDEETIASGTAAAAAGGYCAILAMPNTDPVVDTADVLRGLRARAEDEAADPRRLHGCDHDRPGRHPADRDGRARRYGSRGLHRRRPPGRDRRADAARARIQRHHRPPPRTSLRGADPHPRRPHAHGRRLGRARPGRMAFARREPRRLPRAFARRATPASRST